jgi:hypothetical protein
MKTSGTEDPGVNRCIYTHMIFDKGAQNIRWRKDSFFQQMLLGKLDICLQKTESRSPTQHKNKIK